ncbi:MAG: hypothetical protein K2Y21_00395 [Phycisphaerales bacterium]|nr:hypothetical protein [Phycisphaerales bacterium]
MANEFNNIKTYDGWKSKLQEILKDASSAAAKDDADGRQAAAHRLLEFVRKSNPNTAEIRALDDLANEAIDTIVSETAADANGEIARRTGALTALNKRVDSIAAAASNTAKSIRLERAHRVVDAMTEVVRAADDLDSVLTDDDEVLRRKIKKIAGALLELRGEVEESLGRRDA